LVQINKNFHPDHNFWDINPQMIIMAPFNDLYNLDKGGTESSNYAWMCFFMCEPDEEQNIFFRIPPEERIIMLKETYFPEFKEIKEYTECVLAYKELCMTSTERSLLKQKEFIRERDAFLESKEYTLDASMVEQGKVFTMPGTAKQLEAMHKVTPSIYKMLRELEDMYIKEKASGEVYGGRRETLAEKKMI